METEKLESKIENLDAQPNLGKLEQLASEADQTGVSEGFMTPGTKVKEPKKRGRKSKEELAKMAQEQKKAATSSGEQKQESPPMGATGAMPAPPSAESVMLGKFISRAVSNMGVAIAEDPRASMTPDELEAGAEILARLSDKYMPQLMGQYGLEAAALMTFGQYGLRVMAIKKQKALEIRKARERMEMQFANPKNGPEQKKPEDDSFKTQENPSPNVEMI